MRSRGTLSTPRQEILHESVAHPCLHHSAATRLSPPFPRPLALGCADVVVNYVRDAGAAGEVADTIGSYGVRGLAIQADVSNEDQVLAMFARAYGESRPGAGRIERSLGYRFAAFNRAIPGSGWRARPVVCLD
jgi:hypothetical protein